MQSRFSITFAFIVFLSLSVATDSGRTTVDQNYWRQVVQLLKNSPQLQENIAVKHAIASLDQYNIEIDVNVQYNSQIVCQSCEFVFREAQKLHYTLLFDLVALAAEIYCSEAKLFAPQVCQQAIKEYKPIVVQVLIKKFLNPEFICPLLKVCPQMQQPIDIKQLIADILADKPKDKVRPTPTFSKIYNILQLADVHTDIEYQVGGNANCGVPECCRAASETGTAATAADEAGYWGTLAKCDIPYRTVQQLINFLKSKLNIDLALWTGDNTSHDVWHQTTERNMNNTIELTRMFKTLGYRFIPNMGNHECFPADQFDWFSSRDDDLKVVFADIWEDWIGSEAAEQHRKFGYYSTFVPEIGVRVLAMNTQVADPINWFLIENPTDPGNFLQWMRSELYNAEANDEKVYIIAHIPNNNLLGIWGQVYSAIVDRFSYTIRGQFFGHTHSDHIMAFKSHDGLNQTVGVQFIAPSLTTYTSRNPSFRVFQVDAETLIPVNYEQYRLNLTYWNTKPDADQLEWDLAYTFVEEYNLQNMYEFDQIDQLINDLKDNLSIYQKYVFNYDSGSGGIPSSISPYFYCNTNALQQGYWDCMNSTDQLTQFVQTIQGPWYTVTGDKKQ